MAMWDIAFASIDVWMGCYTVNLALDLPRLHMWVSYKFYKGKTNIYFAIQLLAPTTHQTHQI